MDTETKKAFKGVNTTLEELRRQICCAKGNIAGGCCYQEVTYAEAMIARTNGTLVKGSLYKITDRGDRGLFFEAVSATEFNPEGTRVMLIPNLEYEGGQIIEWVSGAAMDPDGLVVYKGFMYTYLDFGNSTPPNALTEFALVPKDSFSNNEYREKAFGIVFDWENDWISKQWDEFGNVFGMSFDYSDLSNGPTAYGGNPVDISDWWIYQRATPDDRDAAHHLSFYNNVCIGFWNNPRGSNDGYFYFDNFCPFGIIADNMAERVYRNTCPLGIFNNGDPEVVGPGSITNNGNNGNISYNLVSLITNNINNGDIFANETPGITGNYNNGSITTCVVTNSIYDNGNNGDIIGVTESVPISVFKNINNGDIGTLSPYAADITDAVVNK